MVCNQAGHIFVMPEEQRAFRHLYNGDKNTAGETSTTTHLKMRTANGAFEMKEEWRHDSFKFVGLSQFENFLEFVLRTHRKRNKAKEYTTENHTKNKTSLALFVTGHNLMRPFKTGTASCKKPQIRLAPNKKKMHKLTKKQTSASLWTN